MRLCLRTDWFNQNNKITLHFKDIEMIVSLLIDKKYEIENSLLRKKTSFIVRKHTQPV